MLYRFGNESPLKAIEFSPDRKDVLVDAFVYAPTQPHEKLAGFDAALRSEGFSVSYDVQDGAPGLRVRGFQNERDLLDRLHKGGFIAGAPRQEKTERDTPPKQTAWQKLRANSLFVSAIFYMLGNISTMISGLFRKDTAEFTTGAAFTVGDSSMLLFSRRSKEEKFNDLVSGLRTTLEESGLAVPGGTTVSIPEEQKSLWGKVRNFMKDKVIVIKSLSEMTAGASLFKAGMQQDNHYKAAAGLLVGTGFGLGLVIPQKKPSEIREDMEGRKPTLLKRITNAIQKKPLIVSGTLAAANNLSSIAGAFDERTHQRKLQEVNAKLSGGSYETAFLWKKTSHPILPQNSAVEKFNQARTALQNATDPVARVEAEQTYLGARNTLGALRDKKQLLIDGAKPNWLKGDKFWIFNFLQGFFFLFANTFYGLSSKSSGGTGKGDHTVDTLVTEAANIAALQPAHDRGRAVSLLARHLSQLDVVDFTETEMREKISDKLIEVEANPWLQQMRNIGEPSTVVEQPQADSAQPQPERKEKAWAQRVETSLASPAQGLGTV